MTTIERPVARVRWRDLPGTVWVLAAARTVNRLGAFTLPFLSLTLVEVFGATLSQAGYLLALFGLATIPSRLAGGRLAGRLGGRAPIVLGLVTTAIAQLGLATAPSLPVACAAVVLLGLAFEVYEPASQSMVADATAPGQWPTAYGLMAAGMAVAGMLAGLLAAVLASLDLRWLFVVDAGTCLACAVLAASSLPPGRRTAAARDTRPWRDRRLLTMLGAGTVFAVVYLQITIALPLTLSARGLPVRDVGLVLTVAAATTVLSQPLLQVPSLRRRDDFTAMTVGYTLLGGGLLLTGLSLSLPAFLAATVLWSLGDLVLLGRAHAVVAGLGPAGTRAGYLAAFGVSWGVAAVLAPLVGTQLLVNGGPVLVWSAMAGVCVALAVAQPVVRRAVAAPGAG